MAPHLRRFSESEVAKERLRVIKYYQKYGEKACIEAFGINRKLIYTWRRRVRFNGNYLSALVPSSTRPVNTRTMLVNPKVLDYLKHLRELYPRLGKAKIKPLLDEYCAGEDLPAYSEAKIGRIISKHKLFYQGNGRVYHNPDYNYQKKRKKRLRVKYAPKPKELDYIQMDTTLRIEDGIRYYIYSAIDIRGKFALSLAYKRANAKSTLDFFEKLKHAYPGKILCVQTDNGSEFLGMFEEHLARNKIRHYFIYPRCPRINGVVERYQRSLQEEFVDPNVHLIHNQDTFSRKLADYIIFYNTKRVHQSLNYETPVDYMLKEGGMSNMYRARTETCFMTNLSFIIYASMSSLAERGMFGTHCPLRITKQTISIETDPASRLRPDDIPSHGLCTLSRDRSHPQDCQYPYSENCSLFGHQDLCEYPWAYN